MDYLCQILQHAAIYPLVGPGEVVAGGNGCVLGILHEQFPLHVIDNGGAQEDAHRALALGQQVQLLLLGHGRATLTTGEDDSLGALGDGELAPQFSSGSKE